MSKLLNRIILIGVIVGFIGAVVVLVLLKTGPSVFDKNASEPPPVIVPPVLSTPNPRADTSAAVPKPNPAAPPGITEVQAVMTDYRAKGCNNVLHPPVGVKGTVAWAPTFPDEQERACLVVIAATGDPSKSLTVSIRTPQGEKIQDDVPVPIMDYIYCAEMPGSHSVNVRSATNERYTFAAMDCPFAVAQDLLKQKQAK
jgi:hypothetical protein